MNSPPIVRSFSAWGRVPSRAAALGLLGLTVLTDSIPPRIRFGRWNELLEVLALPDGLDSVPPGAELWRREQHTPSGANPKISCVMVSGALDTGGVETIVAALAQALPSHGIAIEVACSEEGRISTLLRNRGVRVTRVANADLAGFVKDRQPDIVQVHRIDPTILAALEGHANRTVPVFHAMESYLDRSTWRALDLFTRETPSTIAVSKSVSKFFGSRLHTVPTVVVNGVAPTTGDLVERHGTERNRLAHALGVELPPDDLLVVALQRFSDQKNPAGLVDAFLLAAESHDRLRLVIAGSPTSWLEVRRADALRRAHPCGDRVHFLGDSDPAALLVGGDMFALNSFAEGGPMAAVEAVACGLPVVLSDVGFARELVAASEVAGRVVRRASLGVDPSDLARERRKLHQSNRNEFAEALLDIAGSSPRITFGPPTGFSERSMSEGHALALRAAAALSS